MLHDDTVVEKTIAAAAATYTANDQVGVMLDLGDVFKYSGGKLELLGITLIDRAKQKIAADVYFFRSAAGSLASPAAPAVTSADQDAFALSDANLDYCVGKVNIAAALYADTSAQSVAEFQPAFPLSLFATNKTKRLYAMVVTRGTPTYTANCLRAKFKFRNPG